MMSHALLDTIFPVPEELREGVILLVDDEPDTLRVMDALLRTAGFHRLVATHEATEVIGLVEQVEPDLIVLDLLLPGPSGLEILASLTGRQKPGDYLPILAITADPDPEIRRTALASGAKDFLTKPFEATEVVLRIRNLLQTRVLHRKLQQHNEILESHVRARTTELAEAQVEILRRLAVAAEYRDDVTGRHAERVGMISAQIGRELGLNALQVDLVRWAAPLHDVGKIAIPDAILRKPGPLTEDEFGIMRGHTEIGARILSGSPYPLLRVAREIALTHHERWDGEGYGEGLEGAGIPLAGRIVAVADVFDSLTHMRPYKGPLEFPQAVEVIVTNAGSQFDPDVVDAFTRVYRGGALDRLDEEVLEAPPMMQLPQA